MAGVGHLADTAFHLQILPYLLLKECVCHNLEVLAYSFCFWSSL